MSVSAGSPILMTQKRHTCVVNAIECRFFFQANNFDGLTLEVWSQYNGDTKE